MIIAVDFDGTIVEHAFPDIGRPVPGAITWMKRWQELGAKLILFTMRSDGQQDGDVLTQAVEYCRQNGVEFWGVNQNPEQSRWTTSPKVYAHVYVDDAAACVPLRASMKVVRPMVDWNVVGPAVENQLLAKDKR